MKYFTMTKVESVNTVSTQKGMAMNKILSYVTIKIDNNLEAPTMSYLIIDSFTSLKYLISIYVTSRITTNIRRRGNAIIPS